MQPDLALEAGFDSEEFMCGLEDAASLQNRAETDGNAEISEDTVEASSGVVVAVEELEEVELDKAPRGKFVAETATTGIELNLSLRRRNSRARDAFLRCSLM